MILFLLSKSYIRVFYKSDALMQEVIDMTAPILELEYEKNERLEKELEDKDKELEELKESNQKELEELKENSRKKLAEKEAELARLRAELEQYKR
jgi:chromosome segregation ATPase